MMNLTSNLKSAVNFYNSLTKREFHKLKNLENVKGLIEHTSSDFKETVLTEYMDEEFFFALTGIRTNSRSIPYYFEFKKKLGKNFSWNMIGNAKSYIHFKNDTVLEVVVPKWEIYQKNIMKFIAILLFLFSIALFFILKKTSNTLAEVISYFFLIMVPILLFYLVMKSIDPVLSAIAIEKRLATLEN